MRLPELATMYATSSALVVGYTVVVAPPAARMPKSTTTHSYRVPDASATRSSGLMPSAIRPAAMCSTRSPNCCQLTLAQPSSSGKRNASAFGVAATRSRNILGTDGARFSILPESIFSWDLCGPAMGTSV